MSTLTTNPAEDVPLDEEGEPVEDPEEVAAREAFKFVRSADEYSLAELIATSDEFEPFMASLTEEEATALEHEWSFFGRPKQLWPGEEGPCGPDHGCEHAEDAWTTWAIIAGRGYGKTWTGAQATRRVAERGQAGMIHLLAPTPADYRDVMIEGPAGLQRISPKWSRPEWFPSKRLLLWPNGVRGLCFSAEDPEALRGPQCGFIWGDEPGAWTYGQETWDMAQLGLRMGRRPRQVITTTPKPFEWLEEIVFDGVGTHLTSGSTYENLQNLAETFARTIIRKYEGTNLGRQELLAEFLHAVEGALWWPELLEQSRRHIAPADRVKAAVAVDPNVSSAPGSDECGIVSGFVAHDELYVARDLSLSRPSPEQWARVAVNEYHRIKADALVAEVNNGGDLVKFTIKTVDPTVNVHVVHASRGKEIRAQPVASLFEQNRAHILRTLPALEDQLCKWVPGVSKKSPDRLDACVWLGTYLMIDGRKRARLIA